jgi:diguanylate cyclase (GGDEF)-like protein
MRESIWQFVHHWVRMSEDRRQRGRLILLPRVLALALVHLILVVGYTAIAQVEWNPPSSRRMTELVLQVGTATALLLGLVYIWIKFRRTGRAAFVVDWLGTALFSVVYSLFMIVPDLLLTGPGTTAPLGRFILVYSWFMVGIAGGVLFLLSIASFASLFEEERMERRRLEALIRFTERLSHHGQEALLDEAATQLQKLMDADSCVLYLWRESEQALVPVAGRFNPQLYPPGYIEQMMSFKVPVGFGATGRVMQTGQAYITGNARHDPYVQPLPGSTVDEKSGLFVPIGEGTPLGVVRLIRSGENQFNEEDLKLASSFARQAALVLEHARVVKELADLSITDDLTGLYNSRHFFTVLERELERAKRYGHPISLVMLDSDTLKQVNDQHGHQKGDEHLRMISQVLKENLRSSDWAFRYAGDEFVLILPMTEPEDAMQIGERLRQRIATVGEELGIANTISVGVAAYPYHALNAELLLGAADRALYQSKRSGKNRISLAPLVQVPAAAALQPEQEELN